MRENNGHPLRFGIMCHGLTFAAWEAACIRELLATASVEAALLIIDDRPPAPRSSKAKRLRDLFDPRTILWRLYQRLALNRRSASTQPVDLSEALAGVPTIRCRPNQFGKWVQRFQPQEVAEIRGHNLDFVMRFAFNILRGDILDSARYGIWSFHHDDPDKYRGQPPGFWEIYRKDPVIGVVLQRLTEKLDAGIILHRGWFAADPSSYAKSRDAIFFGAVDWPARLCRQIQRGVADNLETPALPGSSPIYRAPNSLQMLRFIWVWMAAVIGKQVDQLFRAQQWGVGVIDAPIEDVVGVDGEDNSSSLVTNARWLPEPPGRFLADPFAIETSDGGLTIMAEDFDWRSGRGHIASIEVDVSGNFASPVPAIHADWHLSYPYLIRQAGELICVPEAHESGEAALYSCIDNTWRRAGTLIANVAIVDPTIFKHDGRWWLFGTCADHGANLKLFAWYADSWNGPWTAHTANPLKTDVRSSRPAGAPFSHAGALYRPAQDCSTGYGAAVVVHRITTLTPDRFEEEEVKRVAPNPRSRYPTGLHTLSGAGAKTVIDGSRWAFQPAEARAVIRRKFSRLRSRQP